jgi:hypothetical protein
MAKVGAIHELPLLLLSVKAIRIAQRLKSPLGMQSPPTRTKIGKYLNRCDDYYPTQQSLGLFILLFLRPFLDCNQSIDFVNYLFDYYRLLSRE